MVEKEIGKGTVIDGKATTNCVIDNSINVGDYELTAEYLENTVYNGSTCKAILSVGYNITVFAPDVYYWENRLDDVRAKGYFYAGVKPIEEGRCRISMDGYTPPTSPKYQITAGQISTVRLGGNTTEQTILNLIYTGSEEKHFNPGESNNFYVHELPIEGIIDPGNPSITDFNKRVDTNNFYPTVICGCTAVNPYDNTNCVINVRVVNSKNSSQHPTDGWIRIEVDGTLTDWVRVDNDGMVSFEQAPPITQGSYEIKCYYKAENTSKWNNGIGTGALIVSSYEPNIDYPTATSVENEYSGNRGDTVEVICRFYQPDGNLTPVNGGRASIYIDDNLYTWDNGETKLVSVSNSNAYNYKDTYFGKGWAVFRLTLPDTEDFLEGGHVIKVLYYDPSGEVYTYNDIARLYLRRPTMITFNNANSRVTTDNNGVVEESQIYYVDVNQVTFEVGTDIEHTGIPKVTVGDSSDEDLEETENLVITHDMDMSNIWYPVLNVTITDEQGEALPDMNVSLSIDGNKEILVTDTDGIVTKTIQSPDNASIEIKCGGEHTNYNENVKTIDFVPQKTTLTFNEEIGGGDGRSNIYFKNINNGNDYVGYHNDEDPGSFENSVTNEQFKGTSSDDMTYNLVYDNSNPMTITYSAKEIVFEFTSRKDNSVKTVTLDISDQDMSNYRFTCNARGSITLTDFKVNGAENDHVFDEGYWAGSVTISTENKSIKFGNAYCNLFH